MLELFTIAAAAISETTMALVSCTTAVAGGLGGAIVSLVWSARRRRSNGGEAGLGRLRGPVAGDETSRGEKPHGTHGTGSSAAGVAPATSPVVGAGRGDARISAELTREARGAFHRARLVAAARASLGDGRPREDGRRLAPLSLVHAPDTHRPHDACPHR